MKLVFEAHIRETTMPGDRYRSYVPTGKFTCRLFGIPIPYRVGKALHRSMARR